MSVCAALFASGVALAPPPPLAPRAEPAPIEESQDGPDPAIWTATGIGIAGLAVGSVSMAFMVEEPTDATRISTGVGLGVGLMGLAAAGVAFLVVRENEGGDGVALGVGPGAAALSVRF